MSSFDTKVAIVGGGAAGIAAARRLTDNGIDCLIVEARERLGGRSWTVGEGEAHPVDLGCGWLHSADGNPWLPIAEAQGRTIDRTPPPWRRSSLSTGFAAGEQSAFQQALDDLDACVHAAGTQAEDRPAETCLPPGGRWNALANAVSTYANGVELDRVSVRDLSRYHDSGVNWRVPDGYGSVIKAHAAGLRISLGNPVRLIDHSGKRLRLETDKGTLTADAVIVTLPTSLLARQEIRFLPDLPDKTAAAEGLPLGLADKLFLSLSSHEEFPADSRAFGSTDRTATAAYHVRPFGRPQIEAYFAGALAAELEIAGKDAFFDFAVAELVGLFGSDFARRVKPIHLHPWRTDPYARGSYSHALPGHADSRAVLAAPVDDRLFFAGEACSLRDFSTAHGALQTGLAAADLATALFGRKAVTLGE
ncbi:flavin monoamine oxidase family protein [Microvirga antarctica]|uniref:flavin monoamine oxidase family protein n=1 Tax=Microvirga antarctica TaxID=2819233 RepID=UPI001B306CF9|nr:NAD(P)/FAD-dependent oxidoreductase [Microvirga antarctica]